MLGYGVLSTTREYVRHEFYLGALETYQTLTTEHIREYPPNRVLESTPTSDYKHERDSICETRQYLAYGGTHLCQTLNQTLNIAMMSDTEYVRH